MTTSVSISRLLSDLKAVLAAAGFAAPDAAREARLILAAAAGLTAADLLARLDLDLAPAVTQKAQNWAARRAAGEPLSRIKGTREFYGLDFILSSETLDPRPETEMIVDLGLRFLKGVTPAQAGVHKNKNGSLLSQGLQRSQGTRPLALSQGSLSSLTPHPVPPPKGEGNSPLILDFGTGTGCIPISLLVQLPQACAVAVDISDGALDIAGRNAALHGVANRLTLIRSDWAENIPKDIKFDLITANPPYIPAKDISALMPEVRDHDPIRALDGGEDGIEPYRLLFPAVKMLLKSHGLALFEMGIGQADDLMRLAEKYGLDVSSIWNDDNGIPRVIGVSIRPVENKYESGA